MFIEIKNTRNLELQLQSAVERDLRNQSDIVEKSSKPSKEPKEKTRLRDNKTVRKFCWVILIALIVLFIGLTITEVITRAQRNAENEQYQISDTRVFRNESWISHVKYIANLYAITDKASYSTAIAHLNMSDDLKSRLFPNDSYTDAKSEKGTVTVEDIEYELLDSNTEMSFIVYIKKETDKGAVYYIVQAVYDNDTLIDLISLN